MPGGKNRSGEIKDINTALSGKAGIGTATLQRYGITNYIAFGMPDVQARLGSFAFIGGVTPSILEQFAMVEDRSAWAGMVDSAIQSAATEGGTFKNLFYQGKKRIGLDQDSTRILSVIIQKFKEQVLGMLKRAILLPRLILWGLYLITRPRSELSLHAC